MKEENLKTISFYCKQLRESTGLSVLAFSKQKGVSHTYIQNVESGKYDNKPSPTTLAKLIAIYDINTELALNLAYIFEQAEYKKAAMDYLESTGAKYKKVKSILNISNEFSNYLIKNNYFIDKELNISEYKKKKDKYDALTHFDIECHKDIPCYVYFINDVPTTRVDEKIISVQNSMRNILGSIVLDRNIKFQISQEITNKYEAEFKIVTANETMFNYIFEELKTKLNLLNKIDIELFCCKPGKGIIGPVKLN